MRYRLPRNQLDALKIISRGHKPAQTEIYKELRNDPTTQVIRASLNNAINALLRKGLIIAEWDTTRSKYNHKSFRRFSLTPDGISEAKHENIL